MSSLNVTIIQSDLHWEDKKANLSMFEKKIDAIEGAEIVILPEMFSTGFSMQPEKLAENMQGETIGWMKKMAAKKNIILTGSVIIEDEGHYYNRLVWMLPDGQCGIYDKRHRFAYAEEDQHYTAGNKRLIASVKGWRVNLLVCYDLRFPVWARQQPSGSGHEYDLLVYVANWPGRRQLAWESLLRARAIENQCYVVGVNRVGEDGKNISYTGGSMIIDPLGEILYQKKNEEDIFSYSLDKKHLDSVREKFPFWRDADEFKLLI
jgi:predicted amidohydrolase